MKARQGFTMIELLVVLALMIIIVLSVVFSLGNFNNKQNLELGVNSLVAVIRDTQQRSVTQQDGNQWGIRFLNTASDRYEIFKGSSYASGTLDHLYAFRQGIRFSEPAASSTYDVVFNALTGKIANNKIFSLVDGRTEGLVGDIILGVSGLVTSRIEEGLAGYWHLDETTSTTAYDATNAANSGVLTNGPVRSSTGCRAGSCLVFNGTNNYVQGPSSNKITGDNLQAITISAWVKTTSTAAQYPVAIKRSAAQSTLISLDSNQNSAGTAAAGYLGFLTRNYADSAHSYLVYDGDYNDGQWHHLAAVINGMTRILYIDGVQRGIDTDQGMQSVAGNTASVFIGSFDSSQLFFRGAIDEVRIYKRALTAGEILDIYNDLK